MLTIFGLLYKCYDSAMDYMVEAWGRYEKKRESHIYTWRMLLLDVITALPLVALLWCCLR